MGLIGSSCAIPSEMELESGFEAVKATFDASLLDTFAAVLGIIPNFEAAAERCLGP